MEGGQSFAGMYQISTRQKTYQTLNSTCVVPNSLLDIRMSSYASSRSATRLARQQGCDIDAKGRGKRILHSDWVCVSKKLWGVLAKALYSGFRAKFGLLSFVGIDRCMPYDKLLDNESSLKTFSFLFAGPIDKCFNVSAHSVS